MEYHNQPEYVDFKDITKEDREKARKMKAAIVAKLTEIREDKSKYRIRLAESLGINASTVDRMEKDKHSLDIEKFFVWCIALKVDPVLTMQKALTTY